METTHVGRRAWWVRPLLLFTKLSAWILFPLIIALSLGKYLDRKFHSEPKYLSILLVFSFIISIFTLLLESKKEMRRFRDTNLRSEETNDH